MIIECYLALFKTDSMVEFQVWFAAGLSPRGKFREQTLENFE
jgi:hypothetical protein